MDAVDVPVPVPGTQYLVDTDSHKQEGKVAADIILVPQPSSDPEEPLNWSSKRKLLNTICYSIYTLCNGIAGSNLYSVEEPLSTATGLSLATINSGTGYLFLLAGWGLLFWQPFALQYGKRLTYIVTLLAIIGLTMWSPYITSDGQWYARSVLLGFFASPIEALPELSVTDLYFAHQRGTYMGLYGLTLVGSNFLSPLIFGFVNDRQGFRWVFYWTSIICGVGVIVLFFLMEETNYHRVDQATASPHSTAPSEVTDEKSQAQHNDSTEPQLKTLSSHRTDLPRSQKSYLSRLSLAPPTFKPTTILPQFYLQLRFLLWPIPLYAGFAYGSTLIWFNVLNATSSLVLSGPPYNFSSSIVGLAYVAPLIGTLLGFLLVGRASDMLIIRLARRNGGVMEPEGRLWIFALSTLLIPTALLVWGVGSVHGVHWIGLLFAMGMFGFVNTCGAVLGVTYLVDCYREMSGSALTAVIIVRNTMGFAVGYGITPWIENLGQQWAFVSASLIALVVSCHWVGMVLWGKRLRTSKAGEYWRVVGWAKERGMVHS